MGILLFMPAPKNILLLGTGGGSLIHFLGYHYPSCRITSVDNDGELQDLMHEKMLLPPPNEQLTYLIDDARHYLYQCEQQFDLILVDIFSGSQSPDWLLETTSTGKFYGLLTEQGAVAYNLLVNSGHDFDLYYQNQQTLSIPVEGYENRIVYGFRQPPPRREMSYYIEYAMAMADTQKIDYGEILSIIYTTNPIGSGIIY